MPLVRKKNLIQKHKVITRVHCLRKIVAECYMARGMFEITINKSTLMAQAAALYFKSKKTQAL